MKSVGIVQNLDGKFYALEANGNIKVLEIGDTISQGDKIFGDSTNMYTNTVNILFNFFNVDAFGFQPLYSILIKTIDYGVSCTYNIPRRYSY